MAQYCKSKNIGQQVKELEISDTSSDFESQVASEESLPCNKITTDVKTTVLKVEKTNLRMIIDTGSSVNITDKNSFEKVAEVSLKPSKTKIYPYASEPLVTKGYFTCKFETPQK